MLLRLRDYLLNAASWFRERALGPADDDWAEGFESMAEQVRVMVIESYVRIWDVAASAAFSVAATIEDASDAESERGLDV